MIHGEGKGFKTIVKNKDDLVTLKTIYGDNLVIIDPDNEVGMPPDLLNEMQSYSAYKSNTQNYWGEDILDNLLEQ